MMTWAPERERPTNEPAARPPVWPHGGWGDRRAEHRSVAWQRAADDCTAAATHLFGKERQEGPAGRVRTDAGI